MIDFGRMVQIRLATNFERRIRRFDPTAPTALPVDSNSSDESSNDGDSVEQVTAASSHTCAALFLSLLHASQTTSVLANNSISPG